MQLGVLVVLNVGRFVPVKVLLLLLRGPVRALLTRAHAVMLTAIKLTLAMP